MKNAYLTMMVLLGLLVSSVSMVAEARTRSSARDGFNFGASLRLLDADDRTYAATSSENDVQVKSGTNVLNPYVGYAFWGLFNLGVSVRLENGSTQVTEQSKDGLQKTVRTKDTSAQGASLFGRFMFGQVMYLEAGGGIYHEKATVSSEMTTDQGDGTFSGQKEKYDVKGMGPGYHFGMGAEIPIGSTGFFFTSAYTVRIFQLKDSDSQIDLFTGRKRSFEQRRELMFGLANYLQ